MTGIKDPTNDADNLQEHEVITDADEIDHGMEMIMRMPIW
jgi:hypothetical protein